MPEVVPLVDYLVLGDRPHLVANECADCGARYFDRRNACANCFGTEFTKRDISTEGRIRTFTVVSMAPRDIPVPFVSAIVDCDGTSVRANIMNVDANPEAIAPGMKVRLATHVIGVDNAGTSAVSFGFEPMT